MRCTPVQRSIGWFAQRKRVINFDPAYQREAGAWSSYRKTLFIDSLLNNYDIPKIYLHENDEDGFEFAVIDGKQRITTFLDFLNDGFALDDSFEYTGEDLTKENHPLRRQKFSQFTEDAKQAFRDISLSVTMVQKADDQEIEALFTRLNDGEPLNSAEYRNGIGGEVVSLIREVADHEFFEKKISYSNKRFQYRETSCRLLFLEWESMKRRDLPDLKKISLDSFVRNNKNLSPEESTKLLKRVHENLNFMMKVFGDSSKELSGSSMPQVYYVWLREIRSRYNHPELQSRLKEFIEEFVRARLVNNKSSEDERDHDLSEFTYLSSQGTGKAESISARAAILTKRFLSTYPDTAPLDQKRSFNDDERYVIFARAEKKCQKCQRDLTWPNFHADHVVRHSEGGQTTLENAQALCEECNLKKG